MSYPQVLITEQEVDEILQRHKTENETNKFLTLPIEERSMRIWNQIDEKFQGILKMLGVNNTTQTAKKEDGATESSPLQVGKPEETHTGNGFSLDESSFLSCEEVDKITPKVFDKSPLNHAGNYDSAVLEMDDAPTTNMEEIDQSNLLHRSLFLLLDENGQGNLLLFPRVSEFSNSDDESITGVKLNDDYMWLIDMNGISRVFVPSSFMVDPGGLRNYLNINGAQECADVVKGICTKILDRNNVNLGSELVDWINDECCDNWKNSFMFVNLICDDIYEPGTRGKILDMFGNNFVDDPGGLSIVISLCVSLLDLKDAGDELTVSNNDDETLLKNYKVEYVTLSDPESVVKRNSIHVNLSSACMVIEDDSSLIDKLCYYLLVRMIEVHEVVGLYIFISGGFLMSFDPGGPRSYLNVVMYSGCVAINGINCNNMCINFVITFAKELEESEFFKICRFIEHGYKGGTTLKESAKTQFSNCLDGGVAGKFFEEDDDKKRGNILLLYSSDSEVIMLENGSRGMLLKIYDSSCGFCFQKKDLQLDSLSASQMVIDDSSWLIAAFNDASKISSSTEPIAQKILSHVSYSIELNFPRDFEFFVNGFKGGIKDFKETIKVQAKNPSMLTVLAISSLDYLNDQNTNFLGDFSPKQQYATKLSFCALVMGSHGSAVPKFYGYSTNNNLKACASLSTISSFEQIQKLGTQGLTASLSGCAVWTDCTTFRSWVNLVTVFKGGTVNLGIELVLKEEENILKLCYKIMLADGILLSCLFINPCRRFIVAELFCFVASITNSLLLQTKFYTWLNASCWFIYRIDIAIGQLSKFSEGEDTWSFTWNFYATINSSSTPLELLPIYTFLLNQKRVMPRSSWGAADIRTRKRNKDQDLPMASDMMSERAELMIFPEIIETKLQPKDARNMTTLIQLQDSSIYRVDTLIVSIICIKKVPKPWDKLVTLFEGGTTMSLKFKQKSKLIKEDTIAPSFLLSI